RLLVPGTDGPEDEQAPQLAFDPIGSRVYLVWLQQGRQFTLAGYGVGGWQDPVDLAGDPSSAKRNPQLATSVVSYETLGADGKVTTASRPFLHLVWFDDAPSGARLLYTAVALEGDAVVPSATAFDLRQLAGAPPAIANATPAPASLLQRPLARRGRDGDTV